MQIDPVKAAALQQQSMQMQQQMHAQFIQQTSMLIYANLVAQDEPSMPNEYRACAQRAKQAAPFLAEALGMIKIEISTAKDADKVDDAPSGDADS